jgi:hypothetical protein
MTNLLISGSSAWDQTGKTAKKGEEAFSGYLTAEKTFSRDRFCIVLSTRSLCTGQGFYIESFFWKLNMDLSYSSYIDNTYILL